MSLVLRSALSLFLALALSGQARADDVLFENVRIFDGSGAALTPPSNVLVRGEVIAAISEAPIAAEGAARIAGEGRTLAMATSVNGELLQLTGPRNPYPGRLGVVEEGALADLLLVEGDPLADIDLIADPERNFRVIMKDGRIYRNALGG